MVLNVDRRARLVTLAVGCIVLVVLVAGAIASGASSNERPLRLHLATHVSSGIAKAFPVLRSARASDAAEASQLASRRGQRDQQHSEHRLEERA
jgi:hypothetical protein